VPVSVASDPAQSETLDHTIRAVGRVTRVLAAARSPGDRLGLRGPYGRGWPLRDAEGQDLLVITGGLGCAPVVAAIAYAVQRRDRFRRLMILQGVKHSADMIWRSATTPGPAFRTPRCASPPTSPPRDGPDTGVWSPSSWTR
jgi:sulfhydrogenase subunit gamma (sulfur reductase)